MSETPRVSVLINCLNGEAYLRECLESVMAQTFQDFEVIFWDNCSTDSSPEIARSFGEKVRCFRGDRVVPLGAGRNLAIARARGGILAFLDCDDLWEPTKLARQVALFDTNPRVGLVTTDTWFFDGRKKNGRVFERGRPARGMVFGELIERQWISMSSAAVRREALAGIPGGGPETRSWQGGWFEESLSLSEEADVFYRIAHDWELDYVDEPLTLWRLHGANSTLRRFAEFARETRIILQRHRAIFPGYDRDHPELVRLLERRADFDEAVALWQRGEGAKARALLARWPDGGRKFQAFRLLSHLPGSCFDMAAKIYFALPKFVFWR